MAKKGSGWSIENFGRILRGFVHSFWAGATTVQEFVVAFADMVWAGYTSAYKQGLAAAGVLDDEMTDEETGKLNVRLFDMVARVPGFGTFIEQHSKANKFNLGTTAVRTSLWVNNFMQFYNLGLQNAKTNPKLLWQYGHTKQHCSSCARLNGKVKRASQWKDAGLYPKSHDLECKGYFCDCRFVPTKLPMSKGRLPKI
jgi:hypothetical protein